MSQSPRDVLIAWLRDAHAMESALEKTLLQHARHAESDPTLQARINEHIEVTQQQAVRLEQCLARYDSDVSTTKELMGKMSGYFQGLSTCMADDNKIKDVLMGIGAEHFEIGCYRALEIAAEAIGDYETAGVAHQNRQEEQSHLLFLESIIPEVTMEMLRASEASHITGNAT